MRDLIGLTIVRVKLFFREPEALFWVIFFPLIMAIVLGFAFREQSVEKSRVAIAEGSATIAPSERTAMEAAGIEIQGTSVLPVEDATNRVHGGAIDAALVPGASPRVVFDPAREPSVLARLRIREAFASARASGNTDIVDAPTDGEGNRYIDWLFPALLGMNLMGTGLWGIGFAIAEQRQKKLLRRFLVTPMKRSSYLLSFVLSRMVFLVVELAILLSFGFLILGVPLAGSVINFAAVSILGTLAFAGVGLMVASRPKTIEGISGILNLVMMPMWLCSGVFFSYERFPEAMQGFCRALPLTALNDALRGIMLEGVSLLSVGSELLVLVLWGVISFFLALKFFRWD